MNRLKNIAFLIGVTLLVVSCGGKDFVRPQQGTFNLGVTTYSEVVNKMGEPPATVDYIHNGYEITKINYYYTTLNGEPVETGAVPSKDLVYFFHDDLLVGETFVSSFKAESTNFDETRIRDIKKGITSRDEVIQIFGQPTHRVISPMCSDEYKEFIGYAYRIVRSSRHFYGEVARFGIDNNDIVTEIEYQIDEK